MRVTGVRHTRWFLVAAAGAFFVTSCDSTLSHRGTSRTVSTYSVGSGEEIQSEGCEAVCGQIAPNGRCIGWIEARGRDCIEELQ